MTLLKTFFYSGVTNYLLSSIKNFFIHDHQQQLHQTFSFMIINNNFIIHQKLFIHDHRQQLHQTFSFMIINNNFIKLFIHDHQQQLHDHQQLHQTFSFTPAKYIHSHHPTPPHGQHIHHRSTCPYNHRVV